MPINPPPPATPRRSTRTRPGASKPPPDLPTHAPDQAVQAREPLAKLKFIESKNKTDSCNRPPPKSSGVPSRNHLARKEKAATSIQSPAELNHVDHLTKGIQKIYITPAATTSKPVKNEPPAHSAPSNFRSTVPLADQINSEMKIVNANLSRLSSIRKSGWKADLTFSYPPKNLSSQVRSNKAHSKEGSHTTADGDLEEALGAIHNGYTALQTLRKLISNSAFTSKLYDVERAGLALVNHAIELQLFNSALRLLESAHGSLQALVFPAVPAPFQTASTKSINPSPINPTSWQHYEKVMTFLAPKKPHGESTTNMNRIVLLIMTAIAQGFQAFLNGNSGIIASSSRGSVRQTSALATENVQTAQMRADCCLRALELSGGLDQWLQRLDGDASSLPETDVSGKILGIVQCCYSSTVKACSGWEDLLEPRMLFQLRKRAVGLLLACQVRFKQLKPVGTSFDQARRTLLLYARARPNEISDVVSEARTFFTQIVQVIQVDKTPGGSQLTQNTGWKNLCEVVIGLARKTGDIELANETSTFLASTSEAIDDGPGVTPNGHLPTQTISAKHLDLLLLKITTTSATIDHYLKTDEDKEMVSQLENSTLAIAALAYRFDVMSTDQREKVNVLIDRLRRMCVRTLKKIMTREEAVFPRGARSACVSVSQAIADWWVKHLDKQHHTADDSVFNPALLSMMIIGIMETFMTLAESTFRVDCPDSHHQALRYLGQCPPLLERLPEPDVSPVRCVTSAYYNTGVALYQADKLAIAIDFVKPSCELPYRFFNIPARRTSSARWSNYDDINGELEGLRRQLINRWELLALCSLRIDKSQSYQAYVSAIESHPLEDFGTLGKLADNGSDLQGILVVIPDLGKLIQRATWLATCDMLLPMSQCSLMESLSQNNLSNSELGAILELQLQYLYRSTRKSECRLAIKAILDDCSQNYPPVSYPLRRARALTWLMEWHVSMSADSRSDSTYQILGQLLEEVSALLDASDCGFDDCFKPLVGFYQAMAHMWRALGAQSRNLQQEFLNNSNAALSSLEKLSFPASSPKPQLNPKKEPHPTSKPRPVVKARTVTRTVSKSDAATTHPATTPAKNRVDRLKHSMKTPEQKKSIPKPPSPISKATSNKPASTEGSSLDGHDRYDQHLRLFAHVLGAHGMVSLKVRALEFLQHLGSTPTRLSSSKRLEDHISTTIELALTYLYCEEYTNASTLLSDAERLIKSSPMHTFEGTLASECLISLLYSRCFSDTDDLQSPHSLFISAGEKWALANEDEDYNDPTSGVSSTQKIIKRTNFLRMMALASFTYSHLKEKQGDLTLAIEFATRAVRLLRRASSNILRISTSPSSKATGGSTEPFSDVFTSNSTGQDRAPLPEMAREVGTQSFVIECHPAGEISWQIASMIPAGLKRVIDLYTNRGSPRMAEAYLNQFHTITDQIGSHVLKTTGMVIKANILTVKRHFDDATSCLQDASVMVKDRCGPELAEICKLKCEISYQSKSFHEARANCTQLVHVLQQSNVDGVPAPRFNTSFNATRNSCQSSKTINGSSTVASTKSLLITAQSNRIQVLVARALRQPEQMAHALRMLSRMPHKIREKVFESTLLAMIELDDAFQNFRVDPLLGVLPEAMIAMPSDKSDSSGRNSPQDQFPQLSRTLNSMEAVLCKQIIGCADVPNLYESIHVLITLQVTNSILQRQRKNVAGVVASLLDFVCSLTIRREMLESARAKLRVLGTGDDTSWPSETDGVTRLQPGKEMQIEPTASVEELKRWQHVASQYHADIESPGTYRPVKDLPIGWQVVSMHLTSDKDSLFLIQHNGTCHPLGIKLPLDRFNRREGEDEPFTLEVALKELHDIVTKSNAATQRARHVTGRQDKISWWQERKELDIRMRDLVENIENHWLGACKGLLCSGNKVNGRSALPRALEKLFRQHLLHSQDKNVYSRSLDEHVVKCFTSLPINCRDEDLEDLVQFAVDSYQIHEAPVVGDEVDIDQVVCELRTLQKEYLEPLGEEQKSRHLFLILDKHLHGFPWEVLPILMGQSVSRIPSLSFLRDRISDYEGVSTIPMTLDSSRTSYILNPSCDLASTQSKFEGWLESQPAWHGIKGRPPSSEEVKQALLSADLMLYFGHGGAEQYIRSQSIKQLPRCAATMLWGCSSGMLLDQGDFEPTGTPYAYMLAGCPSLLANLWDVTDKDIDKLAIDLFQKTGLQTHEQAENFTPMTLTHALAQARSSCQLKYLNGAAPVVYGIPVEFSNSHNKK